MWKRLDALRMRWVRRASYAGAALILLVGTWLVEDEMCRTSTTPRIHCALVPAEFYWATGIVAVVFGVWAALSFWRDTPGADS
jgi:hypothetical protein